MAKPSSCGGDDLFAAWMQREQEAVPRIRGGPVTHGGSGLRFALYGRISTCNYQDQVSSRRWQHDSAVDVVAGHGAIVVEYFDVGCSRSRPWMKRPQARELLAAIAQPGRGFEAIVVGEYERAFAGDQLKLLLPILRRNGVQLWLPEVGGPVDDDNLAHQALIMLLGHQSRREVLRSRFRTAAAMRAQVREQGRHLGGRAPYGYRLADAGPHPNRAHARWGRRLHRLDPDPQAASNVRWIFEQRLAGRSAAGIARALNDRGVPPPSAHDRVRNPHRTGEAWTLRTVAEILANPRYTGRQVWNRQRTDHNETDPGDKRTSRGAVRRWNPVDQWVVSTRPAHPALVSDDDFVAVQAVNAVAAPEDGQPRRYLLTGLVVCSACGRRADAHWVHGRPSYRCRHGRTSATPRQQEPQKALYIREDILLARIALQLGHISAASDGPAAISAYLRINQLTIICDARTIALSGSAPGVPAETGRPPQQRPPPGRSET
jgi:site-specific DNA recombinase